MLDRVRFLEKMSRGILGKFKTNDEQKANKCTSKAKIQAIDFGLFGNY